MCDGQSVADSNSPQSRAIREDIPRRIAAGQSDAEIRAYYVSRVHRERILETPSNSGLGIVAWGVPALAVMLGAVGIVVAVRRWSNTPRLTATDEDEDIVRRARAEEAERRRGRRVTDDDDPDGARSLEDERDFLLRSLDDLDSELVAGNIDPDTYRVLHDDYTAAPSAVIQSIADGVERHSPDAPRVPPVDARAHDRRHRRVRGAGRGPARATRSANAGRASRSRATRRRSGPPTTVSAAQAIAAAKAGGDGPPKSYDARIRYARRAFYVASLYPAALQEYIVAAKLDPTQAEPLAYTGWLTGALRPQPRPNAGDAAGSCSTRRRRVSTGRSPSIRRTLTRTSSRVCCSRRSRTSSATGATAFQQFLVTAPDDHPLRADRSCPRWPRP